MYGGGLDTDCETFEEARDSAVAMLERVGRAAMIIIGHLNQADRFEDLEDGWREALITRVAPPA